jgi:serine O-acetyltransferase
MIRWYRHIYLDYRRYRACGESAWTTICMSQGFWASCVYRVSRALVLASPPGVPQKMARACASMAKKWMEIVTGICIPWECEIGEGLYIGHFGTIVLPVHGRLGSNCNIAHNLTIGMTFKRGRMQGAPRIGDRVFIGAQSVLVGDIAIGDDAMICAGSVVTRSVPAGAVVMGNPARTISHDGSFDYVNYDGMDADPKRRAALERTAALRGNAAPVIAGGESQVPQAA